MREEASTSNGRGEQARPASRTGERVRLVAGLTLMAIALVVLGRQIAQAGPLEVARRVAHASWPWLAILALFTAGRFAVFAAKLAYLTRRIVPCTTRSFLPIVMASQLVGLCFPGLRAGAAYLRAHLAARRFGGGTALHLSPNIVDQMTGGAGWLLVAATLSPLLVERGGGMAVPRPAVWLALAALAAALLGVIMRRVGPRLVRWLERPRGGRRGRLASASSRTMRGVGRLASDWRALTAGLAGGVAFLVLTGAAQWAAFRAIDAPVPFWLALMAVTLGTAAGTLAHTPGGLGVTEAAQVAFLTGQGLGAEAAASGVLLARSAHYLFVLAAGGAAIAREWKTGRLRGVLGGAADGRDEAPYRAHPPPACQ